MICTDCAQAPEKICEFHFRLANNHHDEFDEFILISELKTALEDCQRPDHPKNCGTCLEKIRKAARYQQKQLAE